MTKVDIFSGFLGAGKTTLIKKLIKEAFAGEKLVLIENEFGEIGIDGGFMKEAGIEITEMSQGCICCSLVGDFAEALKKVIADFAPDRIVIEPSGVGKLSDVIRAVLGIDNHDIALNSFTTVVDAKKCRVYMKNFGEFFNDQVENANCIVMSRTDSMDEDKLAALVAMLREHNATATIVSTPWDSIDGSRIVEAMEHKNTLDAELERLAAMSDDDDDDDEHEHHHHHHDGECECGHHHHDGDDDDDDDDDDDEDEHEHHHHDDECKCGHHHHHDDDDDDEHEHHHHDGECKCGHHHHHHHGHDADEVFQSFGVETPRKFTEEEIVDCLKALDSGDYGKILRAKGIVASNDGRWIHFDYVPEEHDVRFGTAEVMGRLCVIGSELKDDALKALFRV